MKKVAIVGGGNMGSGIVGLLTVLFVLFQLHRMARRNGRPLLTPALVFVTMVSLVVLLRFDGFSGEMVPQFKYRFARSAPELRSE